jgi:outer membrane protein assembly factor BamE (lipoprotein component of BamABCDE complex)
MLVTVAIFVAGCSTNSSGDGETVDNIRVTGGMSRDDLRFYFGKPLRIEPAPNNGENWYYRFDSRQTEYSSGTSTDASSTTTYRTITINLDKSIQELPVHIGAGGYVIDPVPEGKVVRSYSKEN